MIFRKIVAVYSQNHVESISIELGRMKFMNVTAGDTYCTYGALKNETIEIKMLIKLYTILTMLSDLE
jgi:hypothetical protein